MNTTNATEFHRRMNPKPGNRVITKPKNTQTETIDLKTKGPDTRKHEKNLGLAYTSSWGTRTSSI